MFRIFIVILVLIMPAYGHAEVACKPQPAGKVNVIWGSDNIQYDFTKSQSQMDRMDNDTVNPYGNHAKTHVGGLMKGGISISSNIKTATLSYPRSRQTCQWIGEMTLNIRIDPKIYIARQHKKGSCRHNAILEHEMKHVFVDREVVKRYVPQFKKALEKGVRKVGIVGPKPSSQTLKYQNKISDYMEGEMKKVADKMYAERSKRQAAVDTLKEYERVAAMCR